ncbi:HAD-IC family P-type ATPase [Nonomuraea sp. NPDC055795]
MTDSAGMIRVLLVDDDPMVRGHLRTILGSSPEIEVVGEARDGAEAVEEVLRGRPDVVLMDLRMPGVDGVTATGEIAALADPPTVIALTTFDSDTHVRAALAAGASGYLVKTTPAEDLLNLIRVATSVLATFHEEDGRVRCFVKGAPDVLAARADRYLTADGRRPFDAAAREDYAAANGELAGQGLRVLAVGVKDFPALPEDADLKSMLDGIVLMALVGIVDPARPEAAAAIEQCHRAGVQVRMITGDHAVTAAAIARELDIPGKAVTGAELDELSDEELARQLPDIGVVARVTPQHKIRIVRALQDGGAVVAMTGDGVNDAPALRRADIGVAMGVTGTEVSKEAATMILTDDNFATVVDAVREGRGIYANIVKFTRFQLSTAFGFVLTFLAASITGLAGGAPFTAVQILFVNLIMDGPPALSLGVDPAGPDVMSRPPRPRDERILTTARLLRILLAGTTMAAGTLAVLALAPPPVAATMAFVTFVFFQVFNLVNVRNDLRSAFHRDTFSNRSTFVAIGVVLVLLAAMVEWKGLHAFFSVTNLTAGQWLTCAGVGSVILWLGELVKLILRRAGARP